MFDDPMLFGVHRPSAAASLDTWCDYRDRLSAIRHTSAIAFQEFQEAEYRIYRMLMAGSRGGIGRRRSVEKRTP